MAIKPGIGIDASRALRAVMAADPDVIMIDTTKDAEMAAMAVEAAHSGCLVVSSCTADSGTSDAVAGMLDMGVDPHMLARVFLGALAEWPIRKLCMKCREKYSASNDLVKDAADQCSVKLSESPTK